MMTDCKQDVTRCAGPIEVWLRQVNMEVACTVVNEDESTARYDVDSLSLRGAQREMTGYLISQGYEPVGRWETVQQVPDRNVELDGPVELVPGGPLLTLVPVETVRRFKPKK